MVWTRVMEWLRTPLTIFRQAVWVETCCYAPKVWYFQSGVRSTSYCRAVNSFEMFSFLFFGAPFFLPSVQRLPRNPSTWRTSKWGEYLKDGSIRRFRISLIISSTLMSSSSNPLPLPHPTPQITLHHCNLADSQLPLRTRLQLQRLLQPLMQGSLLPSHGWFTVSMFFASIGCDPGEEQPWLPLHSGQSCK